MPVLLSLLVVLGACSTEQPQTPSQTNTCKEQTGTTEVGKLTDSELREASGLAASLAQPDLLWSHNDSGDEARLFALGKDGRARGQVHLDGVRATDLEDLALGKEGGKSYLYVADMGDNLRARTQLAIYRIEEPTVPATPIDIHVTPDVMTFTYEGGFPDDAETLLFEPATRELFVVTKERDKGHLFRLGPFVKGNIVAKLVSEVPVDTATGGSISPDGKKVVIRDYSGTAKQWPLGPAHTLPQVFAMEACPVALGLDLQGESITFDTDSLALFTTSEGKFAPLHRTDTAP